MRITGARIVIECLAERGVDTVFGYPGGAILNVYDELYRNSDRIRHVLTAHEQGAAHAADGYARASGKVGVVLATSGPGATNLVTGIATAYMDSIPLVAITCNVSSPLIGRDSFQEVSITGITMPITKHNFIVREVEALASTIREAFAIARSGRPGPVLVDIPKDVTAASAEWLPEGAAGAVPQALSPRTRRPTDEEIAKAAELIAGARRPLLMAGGGVISSGASAELALLAERMDIPVACTLMGRGAFPSLHRLGTGGIGMHGSRASNQAAHNADLVIAAGARFSDRVLCDARSFASGARVLHLDIDPAEIGKNLWADLGLVGDLKESLDRILRLLPRKANPAWLAEVEGWKAAPAPEAQACGGPRPCDGCESRGPAGCRACSVAGLSPREVMEAIARRAGEDAIVTTEVGQHQMWAAQYYPVSRPRSFITSGGLGTMGFGTGAAIGAQLAEPARRVVHIAGDGSFRMNCAELATIAHYRLPIVIIVMNNGVLGMVRQWQSMFYDGRYSETVLDRPPDFVKLADAYGIAGFRASDAGGFAAALESAFSCGGPAVVDCRIGIDEPVLPMVPPGRPIAEQVLAN